MKAEKKFDRMPFAVSRPGDSPEMILAIRALEVANVEIRRPKNNPYQLKASPTVSFYPSKGTIYVDGDPAPLSCRGVDALLNYLGQHISI